MVVTDIRMPPNFQREGIDAAKEVRKRHPGTGVVVLSQYDDPEYAISLLADGDQLNEHRAEMNRAVLAAGGTVMQFVGDPVMAVFGAPLPQEDHAGHAVTAATPCTWPSPRSTGAGRSRGCQPSASASGSRRPGGRHLSELLNRSADRGLRGLAGRHRGPGGADRRDTPRHSRRAMVVAVGGRHHPLLYVPPVATTVVVLSVPVTLVLANVMAALPARRAARLRPADVLRAE